MIPPEVSESIFREEQRGGEEEAGGVRRRGENGVQLLRGTES